MRVRLDSSAPSWASRRRHGNGNVNTHWRNPLCRGSTRSIRFAAVAFILRRGRALPVIASILPAIEPNGALVLALAAALVLTALGASHLPARRAASVAPALALRRE